MSNGNAFAITMPDEATTIELKPGQKRRVVFTVQNLSGRVLEGRVRIIPGMPAQQAWYTIDGKIEQRFDADEGHPFAVDIEIPADTQAGRYTFELECAWAERPEELYGTSAKVLVVVSVDEEETNGGVPIWVWFVIGGVVLVIVAGLLIFFLTRDEGVEVPNVTNLTADSATVVLSSFNLPSTQTPRPAIGQAGVVLEQFPDSGAVVSEGDTIELIVAQRAALMPELVGDRWISAMGQISALQLPVSLQTTVAGARDSTVHEQFPSPGDTITSGDSISVTFTVPPRIVFPFPDTVFVLDPAIWRRMRAAEVNPSISDFVVPNLIEGINVNE